MRVLVAKPFRERAALHPWAAFVLRRLLWFALSTFALICGIFAMVYAIPGDPVRNALGIKASQQLVAAKKHELGLDRPLGWQFVHYLSNLASGHLGYSLISGESIRGVLGRQLPATVGLAAAAFLLAIGLALPLGMMVGIATRQGRSRGLHLGFGVLTGLFSAIPDFVLAVGLVFVFAVSYRVLPVAGRGGVSSYILPVVSLAAGPAALLGRIVRVDTQRTLGEDYIRTARAKQLPWHLVYLRHALPNLLTATLTVGGLILSSLLAGTVLVETVFAWPGLGAELVQAILAKDYPMVQAIALFFGVAVLLINLGVDIAIAMLDPRSSIRES